MAKTFKTTRTPAYRQRTGYTQAIVTLTDARTGRRRDYWLGEHGSRESREAMVVGDLDADPPRRPWARSYINSQVKRIQRAFRWAASHELIPASVPHGLATVEALRRGRSDARETDPVQPVPMEPVNSVKPFVSRQVAALIDLQFLTGARPGELVGLRAIDIDKKKNPYLRRPHRHRGCAVRS